MTQGEWREFLQKWSDEWLATDEKFPARVRKQRWLGNPPATETQVAQLEKRLGYALPPSYRNFLLTTNGWGRTSTFIERVRPVSKVNWLETEDPALFDAWTGEGMESIGGIPPEEYFAYDGRPIFDSEHFRKSILIADPVAGDSMIYVLNPLVVAPNGEWEAWRFANWIPGAERFPSFELLMRDEHEGFLPTGRADNYLGPYQGVYAPDQSRHAAKRVGPGRPKPRRLTVPELIAELESPNKRSRLDAANKLHRQYGAHDPDDEHPELVGPLTRILKSHLETDVRSAAAAMLGNYGDDSAVEPLLGALNDAAIMAMVLSALFYLCPYKKDVRIANAMVLFLETPRGLFDTEHAVHILEELEDPRLAGIGLRLLDHAPVVLPDLSTCPDPAFAKAHHVRTVRFLGAFAFAKFANRPAAELVKRMKSPNAEIRQAVAAALREAADKGPQHAEHLKPLLDDADPTVQLQAEMTLRFLEAPPVEASPEDIAKIQVQAIDLLSRISQRKSHF